MTFKDLQLQVTAWATLNFPDAKPHQPLLGIAEESGELAHAHLKMEQRIRGESHEHHAAKIDAVADLVIFLCHYCSLNNIDLDAAVALTWAEVRKRDWKKNKEDGKI